MKKKSSVQHKRRIWFLVLLPLVFAGLFYDSNFVLQVNSFTYEDADLPESFEGYRIVQLSDLHNSVFGDSNKALSERVAELQPDMIVLTGDFRDRFRETPMENAWELGKTLSDIAPTYFVTGNHEWALGDVPEFKEGLEEAGVTVLTNEYVTLERDGDTIVLAGIDGPNGYADQKTPEEVAEDVYSDFGDDVFWLLLAHRNDRFEKEYAALGADLVLTGHAHGGLVRLPFTDGLVSTDRTLFPSFTDGFYTVDGSDSTLFVSRGLGNSGFTFRLFNPPQIVELTLTKGET